MFILRALSILLYMSLHQEDILQNSGSWSQVHEQLITSHTAARQAAGCDLFWCCMLTCSLMRGRCSSRSACSWASSCFLIIFSVVLCTSHAPVKCEDAYTCNKLAAPAVKCTDIVNKTGHVKHCLARTGRQRQLRLGCTHASDNAA